MMLGQRERFRMAIAEKRKQTDGGGGKEEERQNDEQQDAGAEASPKDRRHSGSSLIMLFRTSIKHLSLW